MLNKCVIIKKKKSDKSNEGIHQIDIHKSLLLYEEDNGPGKHEDYKRKNLIRCK